MCIQLKEIITKRSHDKSYVDAANTENDDDVKLLRFKHDFHDMSAKTLREAFVALATRCGTKSAPLILMVDGADRLRSSDPHQKFGWLPKTLPGKHIKLVFSFSGPIPSSSARAPASKRTVVAGMPMMRPAAAKKPDNSKGSTSSPQQQEADCYISCNQFLTRFLPDQEEQETNLILLKPSELSRHPSDILLLPEMLDSMLVRHGIHLTALQHDFVLKKCQACPVPLAVEIAVLMTLQWTASTPLVECNELFASAKDSLQSFALCHFKMLESRHGKPLVAGVSCLITMSLNGMRGEEIETILSYDPTIAAWLMGVLRWSRQRIEGK